MNKISRMTRYLALIMMPLFIVGCGSDDSSLDATLSDLTLYVLDDSTDNGADGGDDRTDLLQGFSSTKQFYTANVAHGITSLILSSVSKNNDASIVVTGDSVVSGTNPVQINLEVGDNTVTVKVTAEEGQGSQSYTIVITRAALSISDATLSDLVLDGVVLNEAFDPEKEDYSASVGHGTSSLTVRPFASNSAASITVNVDSSKIKKVASSGDSVGHTLAVGENIVTVTVTSEDKSTTKEYIITVIRASASTIDATLLGLTLNGATLNEDFKSDVYNYSANVLYPTKTLTLTPKATNENASVTVNGNSVAYNTASGQIPLVVGINTVKVTVTSEDKSGTLTYTLTVARAEASSVTTLQSLTLHEDDSSQASNTWCPDPSCSCPNPTNSYCQDPDPGPAPGQDPGPGPAPTVALAPTFAEGTYDYAAEVDYSTTEVTVSPAATNSGASITVNGKSAGTVTIALVEGENIVRVTVTAENGQATKTYTLTVTRKANSADATLSGLSLDEAGLEETFSSSRPEYTANVAYAITTLTLRPVTSNPDASVTLNGKPATSNNGSFKIDLNEGVNNVVIEVTAKDDETTQIYNLTVTRADASNVATLTRLVSGNEDILDEFDSNGKYTLPVEFAQEALILRPSATDGEKASITVNGDPVASGSASFEIDLDVGDNIVVVKVIAEDGQANQTYTLTVNRTAASTVNTLTTLSLDEVKNDPEDNVDITVTEPEGDNIYSASVAFAVKKVSLTLTTNEYASIKIAVNSETQVEYTVDSPVEIDLSDDLNSVVIDVTSEAGVTKTYTLEVTQAAAITADATLSDFSSEDLNGLVDFESDKFHYTDSVVFDTDEVTVSLVSTSSKASISIVVDDGSSTVVTGSVDKTIELTAGADTVVKITVTSEDSSETETYTLTVARAALNTTDATLSALTLDRAELDQDFPSSDDDYTANVGYLITTLAMTPETTHDGATIEVTVNNSAVASNEGVFKIDLNGTGEEVNNVVIVVTSEDESNTKIYTLDVTRATQQQFAQQAYLKASNVGAGDSFGYSVALDGDTMVVGAGYEDSSDTGIFNNSEDTMRAGDEGALDSGAVYVFTRGANGSWEEQAYLKASNADEGDQFGQSVALDGDTLVVGASYEASGSVSNKDDNNASSAGAVYVFIRTVKETQEVAIAAGEGAGPGEVKIWTEQAYLKADNLQAGDYFGWSVAVDGNTLVVGANLEDGSAQSSSNVPDNAAPKAGAAYVFTRTEFKNWSQTGYLKASNADSEDHFGHSVAVDGDTVVVGAWGEDSHSMSSEASYRAENSGAAYVFTRYNNDNWSQSVYLKAGNDEIGAGDQFGWSVAVDADTVVVGAPFADDNADDNAGAVYVFTLISNTWGQLTTLDNDEEGGQFGHSVALDGDIVVVGAPFEDDTGAVYVFTREVTGESTEWDELAYLKASNGEAGDLFGQSIAVDGDTVVVGASGEDRDDGTTDNAAPAGNANNDAPDAGAVYVWGTNVPAPAP